MLSLGNRKKQYYQPLQKEAYLAQTFFPNNNSMMPLIDAVFKFISKFFDNDEIIGNKLLITSQGYKINTSSMSKDFLLILKKINKNKTKTAIVCLF